MKFELLDQWLACLVLSITLHLVPIYSMDQKVIPSCSDTDDVCEFDWSVDYMWTMIYVNKTRLYGEPVTIRDGTFYRRNILKEHLECDNYEEMTEEELSDTPLVDGEYTLVFAINNQYPGPNIVVYEGQTVVVHVTNNLINEGVTIHWHGLRQRGTPYMDGVSMVTQCPINPDETFTYRFKADTPGTHWYHSTHGVTGTEGINGPLLVLPRKERSDFVKADGDFIMMLQDRYHRHTGVEITLLEKYHMIYFSHGFNENECRFAEKGIDGAVLPSQPVDSIIINGKGHTYDQDSGSPLTPEIPLEKVLVQPNKFYKLRIINSAMLLSFKVSIDNHPLIVIASDGNDIKPIQVESLIIHNGERYDVMIYTQEAKQKYRIRVETLAVKESDGVTLKTPYSTHAILTYVGSDTELPNSERDECTEENPCVVLNCPYGQDSVDAVGFHYKCLDMTDTVASDEGLAKHPIPVPYQDKAILEIFLNFHFTHDDALSFPAVNGKVFHKSTFPLLLSPNDLKTRGDLCGQCKDCRCQHVIKVKKGQIVQLVLSNYEGARMAQSIHLHGHTFHVLKIAYPTYDPETGITLQVNQDIKYTCNATSQQWVNSSWHGNTVPGLNLINPPRKDTVAIPKWGYTVIRFKADNPGFWLMQSQVVTHAKLGMALILQVGEPEDLPPIPDGLPMCGQLYQSIAIGTTYNETLLASTVHSENPEDEPKKEKENIQRTSDVYQFFLIVLIIISVFQFAYIIRIRCVLHRLMLRSYPSYEYSERISLLGNGQDKN